MDWRDGHRAHKLAISELPSWDFARAFSNCHRADSGRVRLTFRRSGKEGRKAIQIVWPWQFFFPLPLCVCTGERETIEWIRVALAVRRDGKRSREGNIACRYGDAAAARMQIHTQTHIATQKCIFHPYLGGGAFFLCRECGVSPPLSTTATRRGGQLS